MTSARARADPIWRTPSTWQPRVSPFERASGLRARGIPTPVADIARVSPRRFLDRRRETLEASRDSASAWCARPRPPGRSRTCNGDASRRGRHARRRGRLRVRVHRQRAGERRGAGELSLRRASRRRGSLQVSARRDLRSRRGTGGAQGDGPLRAVAGKRAGHDGHASVRAEVRACVPVAGAWGTRARVEARARRARAPCDAHGASRSPRRRVGVLGYADQGTDGNDRRPTPTPTGRSARRTRTPTRWANGFERADCLIDSFGDRR